MSDRWQPLSVRRGLRQPAKPADVPDVLRYPLRHWLEGAMGYRARLNVDLVHRVAMRVGVTLLPSVYQSAGGQLLDATFADDDVLLDVLDAVLKETAGRAAPGLRELLELGGSTWTVSADGTELQQRVPPTYADAAEAAMTPADQASGELREAWAKVYGRDPDPSDAWDHAIKAVEAVIVPIVVPKKAKATLGDVLGELKANPGGFGFVLNSSSQTVGPVETVEAMLRMIWPNPDRHGGAATRAPTLAEAETVVQVALTVVQWCRSGAFAKR